MLNALKDSLTHTHTHADEHMGHNDDDDDDMIVLHWEIGKFLPHHSVSVQVQVWCGSTVTPVRCVTLHLEKYTPALRVFCRLKCVCFHVCQRTPRLASPGEKANSLNSICEAGLQLEPAIHRLSRTHAPARTHVCCGRTGVRWQSESDCADGCWTHTHTHTLTMSVSSVK